MTIDRLLLGLMTCWGLVLAGVVVFVPQGREVISAPYLWVLIPMAVFELIAFALGRGAPGWVISMQTRMIAFFIPVVLLLVLPYLAGQPMMRIF